MVGNRLLHKRKRLGQIPFLQQGSLYKVTQQQAYRTEHKMHTGLNILNSVQIIKHQPAISEIF